MDKGRSDNADQFADLEWRYSRRGLLCRYAKGRVRNFASRLTVVGIGAAALSVTAGLRLGLFALALAIAGELVDTLYLRSIPRRIQRGETLKRLLALSTVTGVVQAATIAACVMVAWYGEVIGLSPIFATAFLAGASINAGVVLPYHRLAGFSRLVIYAFTILSLYVLEAVFAGPIDAVFVMNIAGTVLFALMIVNFVNFAKWGFERNRKATLDLVAQSKSLIRHQKEAQRLSLVARNANDSVIISDAKGRIAWVNDAFTRTTGFAPQDAIGKTPGTLLNGPGTDPETLARIDRAIVEGMPFRGEILNVTKDGREIWMETNLVPVLDRTGGAEMFVAVERDVTTARGHAEELRAAQKAAEEGAKAKSEFLATMSHELRTPLNGVIGMVDLLSRTEQTSEQRQYVATIGSSARALLTIIDDILDLSRLDAKKMQLHPADFDFEAFCNETVALMTPQARSKGLSLKLVCDGPIPKRVHGDEGRLRQVVINLIGNAVKFTDYGGITIRVSANMDTHGYELSYAVIDTGIGIAPNTIGKIFDRFSQADATSTRTHSGTGLGLTISEELVRLMQGRITVESTLGEGSCFNLKVPLGFPTECEGAEDTEAEHIANLGGARVLVAEDNGTNRMLLKKYLKDVGLDLHFAFDGHDAVRMSAELRPDIVLMDMSMPGMNGPDAATAIRSAGGVQPRIIAVTANAFESDRQACKAAGMDDFLTKPVGRADLLATLSRHRTGRSESEPSGNT
ncbi:ATP-binding protein [Lutimaribacter marinistellae]|uniref:histidine kinase n=1 Tax=Lutimaribacter marinistellae TaxID=1820329 RepID=A0ABV7TDH4_9RHOB